MYQRVWPTAILSRNFPTLTTNSWWQSKRYTPNGQNFNNVNPIIIITNTKIARSQTIAELRKAKYLHEKCLAANIKANSNLFWGYVRSKLETKSTIGQLQGHNGTDIDDNQEKADLLNS